MCDSFNVETGRETTSGETENNMEENCREREKQLRMEWMGRSKNSGQRQK